MRDRKILILGAGLAGLSTAYFLEKRKITASVFEKEDFYGGLCRSYKIDGFTFDISGHLLHFRNKHSLSLIKSVLGNNLEKHKRKAYVYTFNRIIPYPFQLNFHYLPKEIFQECLSGFVKARNTGNGIKGDSFIDWSYYKFGRAITDYFMVPYNSKFWRFPLDKMHYKGIEKFIVIPGLRDVERSISGRNHKNFGYSAYFWYPKKGGIEKLVEGVARNIRSIHLNHEAKEVDLRKKIVKFRNGKEKEFDILVSTLPLPELSRILKGLPPGLKNEFDKLRWLSIVNINFSVDKNVYPGTHWIYFPDKDIPFFRVGFFHNFSSSLTPQNKGSMYVEVSYSGGNTPVSNIVTKVKNHLKKTGVIQNGIKIIRKSIDNIKYAYPIYDTNYGKSRSRILKFLSKNNIIACGRFGSWQYMSMEDVILGSKKLAARI
ncbi:MAG: hypothetical protein B1H08_02510 [Candidatus Omnitrophica bacterium 4484_171]|nr:MAG: hypothetical protein B1H08_02510 [Candidatus Omnitrophica bacterium 4484_171]